MHIQSGNNTETSVSCTQYHPLAQPCMYSTRSILRLTLMVEVEEQVHIQICFIHSPEG